LDIILPGKSGFEIMEELETAKIKPAFMVISNLGQNEDLERAQKHGSLAYFVKSKVNLDEIAEKLKTFFESEGGKGK
jgi:DNA-binding NarL/FixJ family response regulator